MLVFQVLAAFFIGLFFVYYTIPVIVRISIAKHLYDVPNERKVNIKVIPNLGGIALFIGISMGSLIGILKHSFPDWRFISSSMIILFFIGIKDDILAISAIKKFVTQFLCALILIFLGDIRLTHFHGIFSINEINYSFSVLVSLFAIIGTINAINLIDGIDGLSASIGILAASIFGIIFFMTDQVNYAVLCAAKLGSLISFFAYNVFGTTNKIFMGDTGSLMLGLILSVCAIYFNETPVVGNEDLVRIAPVLTLAILAVPIFDMVRLFIGRIFNAKSPFSADMNHIHHKFLKLGFSHLKSTAIIFISNLFIVGIIWWFRAEQNQTLLFILLFMISALMILPGLIYQYRASKRSPVENGKFTWYANPEKITQPADVKPLVLMEVTREVDEDHHIAANK